MSETAERSIDGEWTRSDAVLESINPDCRLNDRDEYDDISR
jgi:hypothetical protein